MNNLYIKLVLIMLIHHLSIYSFDLKNLPEPYCQLQQLFPFNNHGWYENKKHTIEKLFKHNNISTAIEVGSWLGQSTRHIASLLPNDGYLYAVDTWKGSIEHEINPEWKIFLPTLYEQFLSNVIHAQLTSKIIPVKMTSLQAADFLKSEKGSIDFIYLDAAHDKESVLADLEAYYQFIENGKGILCGDDWIWFPSVQLAVIDFAKQYNLSIYHDGETWFLKEENCFKVECVKNQSDLVWKIL